MSTCKNKIQIYIFSQILETIEVISQSQYYQRIVNVLAACIVSIGTQWALQAVSFLAHFVHGVTVEALIVLDHLTTLHCDFDSMGQQSVPTLCSPNLTRCCCRLHCWWQWEKGLDCLVSWNWTFRDRRGNNHPWCGAGWFEPWKIAESWENNDGLASSLMVNSLQSCHIGKRHVNKDAEQLEDFYQCTCRYCWYIIGHTFNGTFQSFLEMNASFPLQ